MKLDFIFVFLAASFTLVANDAVNAQVSFLFTRIILLKVQSHFLDRGPTAFWEN